MNVLVIAAHPDDEILGCGATLAKHVKLGDDVKILILGEGITSRQYQRNIKEQLQLLRDNAKKASDIIGASEIKLLTFPDNEFDKVPLLEIIHAIERQLKEWYRFDVIYTHSHYDVNIDHRRTFEAAQAVFRPYSYPFKKLLSFEIPSSTEWNFSKNRFQPNCFVDVCGFVDKSLEALKCYESEFRKYPHPRSEEYIKALAIVRGGQANMKAAQAFESIFERCA